MKTTIKRVLQLEKGEGRLVRLFLLHSFCNGITIGFMGASISALFLMRYTTSDLPVMYIVSTSATFITGIVYHRLSRTIRFRRLLSLNLGYSFSLILILTLTHRLVDAPFPALLLAASFELIWVMNSLEFWGLAGKLFDVQQAKRLYSVIGAGEVVAIICSGMLIPFIVTWIGTANLLFIALGGTGCSWVMMRIITHRYAGAMASGDVPIEHTPPITKYRYVVMIFVLVGLAVATLYLVDTAFYEQASRLYPTEEALASFLGIFFALAGVLQLLSRIVFTGRLLKQHGVMVGLMIFPSLLMMGGIGVLIGVGVGDAMLIAWAVIGMKWLDRGLRYTHNQAATLVLYQPLPIHQRVPIQTIAESNIEAVAGFMAGVILLVLTNTLGFGSVELVLILLVMCGMWLGIVLTLRKPYVAMIVQTLTMYRIMTDETDALQVAEMPVVLDFDADEIHQKIITEAENALIHLDSDAPNYEVLREIKGRILRWLATLIHPPELIWEIEQHLLPDDGQQRAYAQEALEMLLMPPLKGVVMPLFDELPADLQAKKLREALDRI